MCESVIHQLWEEYKKKRKAVKVVIREEKRRSRKVTLERIRKQGGTSSKLFWADLKGRKKQTSIDRICDRNGEVFEDRARVLEVLADHWEGLGKSDGNEELVFVDVVEGEEVGVDSTMVWDIVQNLRRGKAVGPDDINNEMMKFGGRRLVEFKYVPDQWMRSYVVPLFKAGDPALPGNYRGIVVWRRCWRRWW